MEMTVPAQTRFVGIVRLTIGAVARNLGMPEEDIDDLKLVVSELCSNAVLHAYPSSAGRVRITCEEAGGGLVVTVGDQGAGFSVVGDLGRLGYGLSLVRSLTDSCEISSRPGGGSGIRITKSIRSADDTVSLGGAPVGRTT